MQMCPGVCFLICSYADANQKAIAQAFFLPPLRDTPPQVLAIDVRNCVWVFKYKRFLTKCVHHSTQNPRTTQNTSHTRNIAHRPHRTLAPSLCCPYHPPLFAGIGWSRWRPLIGRRSLHCRLVRELVSQCSNAPQRLITMCILATSTICKTWLTLGIIDICINRATGRIFSSLTMHTCDSCCASTSKVRQPSRSASGCRGRVSVCPQERDPGWCHGTAFGLQPPHAALLLMVPVRCR